MSAPLSRGIFATSFVHVDANVTRERLAEAFQRDVRGRALRARAGEAPAGGRRGERDELRRGGRRARRRVDGNNRVVACFSAIDNLIKGGAGQAIQSMNLALGLDEPRRSTTRAATRDRRQARRRGRRQRGARRRRAATSRTSPPAAGAWWSCTAAGRRRPSCKSGSGMTPKPVAGRRVTDEATLDVMKMVVAGKLNVDLCAALVAAGARPVGLHGASARVIDADAPAADGVRGRGARPDRLRARRRRRPASNAALLGLLAEHGYVPVLACLGADADGARLQHQRRHGREPRRRRRSTPRRSCLVTDVPGVLRDVADPDLAHPPPHRRRGAQRSSPRAWSRRG